MFPSASPGPQLSAAIRLVEQASDLAVQGVLLPVCHSDARLGLQQDGYCLLRLPLDAQQELRESQIRPGGLSNTGKTGGGWFHSCHAFIPAVNGMPPRQEQAVLSAANDWKGYGFRSSYNIASKSADRGIVISLPSLENRSTAFFSAPLNSLLGSIDRRRLLGPHVAKGHLYSSRVPRPRNNPQQLNRGKTRYRLRKEQILT